MKKLIFSAVMFLLALPVVNAKLSLSVEGGLNGAFYKSNFDNYWYVCIMKYYPSGVYEDDPSANKRNSFQVGYRVGCNMEMDLSPSLYLQSSLFFVNSRYKSNTEDAPNYFSLNSIELPVYLLYKTGKPGMNRFVLGGGPYVGFNMSGRMSAYGNYGGPEKFRFAGDNDMFKEFDPGAGALVGYELKNGLTVKATYNMGFLNMVKSNGTLTHSNTSLTVGYRFGH